MKANKKLLSLAIASLFMVGSVNAFAEGDTYNAYFDDINIGLDPLSVLLTDLDLSDVGTLVVSAAVNTANINGSINIDSASGLTFNSAGQANATASADSSVTDANASVQASAASGNYLKTTVIGSMNDSDVLVNNDTSYTRTASPSVEGSEDLQTDALIGSLAAGLGGFLVATDDNPADQLVVVQGSFNTGDLNASVNISSTAEYEEGWGRYRNNKPYFTGLNIADLAISTVAIGAMNSGVLEITNNSSVNVTTNVTGTLGNTVPQ